MANNKTKEITIDQLKHDLQLKAKTLRAYRIGWKKDLINLMEADKEIPKDMRDQLNSIKIGNVVQDIVKDTYWKVMVLKHMKTLEARYTSAVQSVA